MKLIFPIGGGHEAFMTKMRKKVLYAAEWRDQINQETLTMKSTPSQRPDSGQ